MCPYSVVDVNTETVWVRIVTPLPYAYISAFFSNKFTPCFYFETLYPKIVMDNRAVNWTALHCFFQVALTMPTNGTPSVLNSLPFLPETRNPIIHSMYKRVLYFCLPFLSNSQSQSTQNAISDQIGLIESQQQQCRQIDEQKKVDDRLTMVDNWLGI